MDTVSGLVRIAKEVVAKGKGKFTKERAQAAWANTWNSGYETDYANALKKHPRKKKVGRPKKKKKKTNYGGSKG